VSLQHFFPLIWDSTQLAEAKGCQMSFFRRHIQHLQGEVSIDLVAGGAFAKGIHVVREEFYTKGTDLQDAVAIGIEALTKEYEKHYIQWPKDAKSVYRMQLALESYFDEYDPRVDEVRPLSLADGGHSLEYNLMSEIRMPNGEPILHPTLGVPLLFNGRLDMLAEYIGDYWIVDEKTTGSYFSNAWMKSWEMRDQFSAYCWLAHTSGVPELERVNKVIIRGVSLPSSSATRQDTKDSFYSNIANVKHAQVFTDRSQFMVDNWYQNMLQTVMNLRERYLFWQESGQSPFKHFMTNGGNHCTAYMRNCQFTDSCRTQNGERFLENEEQFIWRPDLALRQPLEEFLNSLATLGVSK